MTLWLSEDDVKSVLDQNVSELVSRLDAAYRDVRGWDLRPRTRYSTPYGSYQYMGAVVHSEDVMGLKTYAGIPGTGSEGVVLLFDCKTGKLLAVMACDHLGRWRTGAASAVATKHLTAGRPISFGVIGTGKQAMTQLAALAAVSKLDRAVVYSRDPARRRQFCREADERFGIRVEQAESAREVAALSNVITTVTPAKEIVLLGSWLDHPCHVNAVGANGLGQRELDSEAFRIADLVVVDNFEQAASECGDLVGAVRDRAISWDDVVTLRAAITQNLPSREGQVSGVTIFESQGLAAWDLIAANMVYQSCLERGLGTQVLIRSEN